LIRYREAIAVAKSRETPLPSIPNYVGEAIMLICSNLMKRPNFSGYSPQYKQEMISDATVDCVAAVGNFDPSRTNNPFAYFTQIAWNAFIRRLAKEKKHVYIKHKNYERLHVLGRSADEMLPLPQFKGNEHGSDIIGAFEDREKNKRQKMLTKESSSNKLAKIGVEKFTTE
jgi:hypothetical protein